MTIESTEPAFFVIKDQQTGKYYERKCFDQTLNGTRAHFDRAENAEQQLKDLQGDGYSIEHSVIIPVYLRAGTPIVPNLMKQKAGFVIEIETPSYQAHVTNLTYWKGNKKKPFDPGYLVSAVVDLRGRPQTLTASIFATIAEAESKLAEIKSCIKQLTSQKMDPDNWDSKNQAGYKKQLLSLNFQVVPV